MFNIVTKISYATIFDKLSEVTTDRDILFRWFLQITTRRVSDFVLMNFRFRKVIFGPLLYKSVSVVPRFCRKELWLDSIYFVHWPKLIGKTSGPLICEHINQMITLLCWFMELMKSNCNTRGNRVMTILSQLMLW